MGRVVRPAEARDLAQIHYLREQYFSAIGREEHPFPFDCQHLVAEDEQGVAAYAARLRCLEGWWYREFFRAAGYRGLRGLSRLYAIITREADDFGLPLVCVTDPRNAPMMNFLIGRSFVLVDRMEFEGELVGMVFVRCPER